MCKLKGCSLFSDHLGNDPDASHQNQINLTQSVIVLCFVVRYFMSILVLQSS